MAKITLTLAIILFATGAAAEPLHVRVEGFDNHGPIPSKFAFCGNDPANLSAVGENISPKITWSAGPAGTKSYAVIVVDRDVPQDFTNANKEGEVLISDMPRQNFYHWLLVNIPTTINSIDEGDGKNPKYGKQLVNDYLKFSGSDKNAQNMKRFSGYDGPCPPFNDERIHYYHFKVFALSERFTTDYETSGDDIVKKISPYILAEGEAIGSYTRNPKFLANP